MLAKGFLDVPGDVWCEGLAFYQRRCTGTHPQDVFFASGQAAESHYVEDDRGTFSPHISGWISSGSIRTKLVNLCSGIDRQTSVQSLFALQLVYKEVVRRPPLLKGETEPPVGVSYSSQSRCK